MVNEERTKGVKRDIFQWERAAWIEKRERTSL